MHLLHVIFDSEIEALYIDGELYCHGDHYHDKIGPFISGFKDGLNYFETIPCELVYVENCEEWELAGELPPETVKELKDKFSVRVA